MVLNFSLEDLDPQQLDAVEAPSPLCILAGAGTGKTRALTHRIAHKVLNEEVPAEKILALTHSQKAAGEMHQRLMKLGVRGVNARTFHSAALRQLKFFWSRTGSSNSLELLANPYLLVKKALEKARLDNSHENVLDFMSEISWAKTQLLTPESLRAYKNKRDLEPYQSSKVFEFYEQLRRAQHKLDFDDLLLQTAQMIENNEEVRKEIHNTYQHFFVDEFQDTDPLQMKLLKAWLGESQELSIVGDPRQSIYGFKGADPEVFKRFFQDYPQANKVELFKDYRSTPQIVSYANTVLAKYPKLEGLQPPGPEPVTMLLNSEHDEENFVVAKIKESLNDGTPFEEMAVLYRFNSQSAPFEAALSKASIPYVVADTERFFERPEVRQTLSLFWRASQTHKNAVGLELLGEVLSRNGFDRNNPPTGMGAARSRFDALDALLTMVEEMPSSSTLGVQYVIEELKYRSQDAHHAPLKGVTLSTLHKAKGLEWDNVFLTRLTEGSLPSAYALKPHQVEEERRLFYVGVTRARNKLFLTSASTNSKNWKLKPSSFISTSKPSTKKQVKKNRVSVNEPVFENCQECSAPLTSALRALGKCYSCMDQEWVKDSESLSAWRRTTAQELKLTPSTFLSDHLLWMLVKLKPTKLSQVVEIDAFNDSPASGYGRDIVKIFKK